MSTRRIEKSHIRKLTKLGGHSIGLTLPIAVVRKLKWQEKQKVVVKQSGKKIIIKDWEK